MTGFCAQQRIGKDAALACSLVTSTYRPAPILRRTTFFPIPHLVEVFLAVVHPREAERGQPPDGGPLTIVRVVYHKVLRRLAELRGQRREKRRNVGVGPLARLAVVALLSVRGGRSGY